ncbi:MAG: tRNA preQ1(34) S-adenosylmethionine ribosyltransferase-isomerase QueA, partial [Amphiplicatus sp.]
MRVSDFDYDLPETLIALEPLPRGAARMLCVGRQEIEDRAVRDLPALLRPGDILVLNDTKVIPAQLRGTRPARGEGEAVEIDVTLHKRLNEGGARWAAFARPAKRLRRGDVIDFGGGFSASIESRAGAEAILRFNCAGAEFDAALARAGAPPLPPYIARKRAPSPRDAADYQTIFAAEPGSIAAPTAGLHFTEALFETLERAGVARLAVTLHVGAGTFLPVTADDARDHVMHAEWGEVTPEQAETINRAKAAGGRVVCVGTTSLRLLESAADEAGRLRPFVGETALFITPGYRFRIADLLMTNF